MHTCEKLVARCANTFFNFQMTIYFSLKNQKFMSNKAATLVPPALVQSTTTKLKAILEEWRPYVPPLTDAEKESMVKMKERSLPFALKHGTTPPANQSMCPALWMRPPLG